MDATKGSIINILGGNNRQFVIPVFQRDYKWTRKDCKQLWSDILRTGVQGVINNHFTGSIVYIEADQPGGAAFQRWLVIDGQQRITTLTLLLVALRDHIRDSGWSGDENSPTPELIDDYYLKNAHQRGERQYRIILRRKDNATLRKFVDGPGISEFDNDVSELVVDAYRFFRSALNEENRDIDQVYRGVCRLNVVDVRLDRNIDDPQMVFESMNSTGVDLSQSDLVRNYLLMGLSESEQTRLYHKYWAKIESQFQASESAFDSFLRDYISLEHNLVRPIRMDRIYEEFKVYWRPGNNKSVEGLLQNIVPVAHRYASFLGIGTTKESKIFEAMSHGRALSTTQAVLMMRFYDWHTKDQLLEKEFFDAVKLVESYLVRRAVLGLQTHSYWAVFAKIAHSIDSASVFSSFQAELARLRDNYHFPTNEKFKRGLEERDLYALRVRRHVLDRLENAHQKEPSPVQDYSIERIMPKEIAGEPEWQQMLGERWEDIHEAWLNRLGNLTLTAYNSEYRNRPFREKKEMVGGFDQSAVRLNEYIRKQTQWTEAQMETRGRKLAAQALEIWPFHDADEKIVQEADIRELRRRAAERNPESLKINGPVRKLLYRIQESVRAFGDVIEVIESKSVCCYAPSFFAELLPMTNHVRVILPLEFSKVDVPRDLLVHDASTWKFVPNRTHTDADLLVDVSHEREVKMATAMIRRAFEQSRLAG